MVSPAPNFDYALARPKRAWWKWSLGLTALLLIYLMWQCGSALRQGRVLAEPAVQAFHAKFNAGNYEEIYQEADAGFTGEGKHDELVKFLTAVHTKLGDAGVTNQVNMLVNAATSGTFITTRYDTTFARGKAAETFTWIKKNGTLKLYGYHIEGNALIEN
jgi:hypothetical protein